MTATSPPAAPPPSSRDAEAVLDLESVTVRRDDRAILDGVSWTVRDGERWVVLGPNGAGKTTLMRVASLYLHPTSGRVRVLGEELGSTDVRQLRTRIGVASQAFADLLRPDLLVEDVVVTARFGALEPWWHTYTDADRSRARDLLARLGIGHLANHAFGTLSSGERQRAQLARTLMGDPGLLLLDEPTAGLDLAAREDLLGRLTDLAADPTVAPLVQVTHHTEEIPADFTHALLLQAGRVLAQGPLDTTLTAESLSTCFGIPLSLERRDGRWLAWSRR
ncbi:MAG TPA: ABC transporter ATP-binding protein [Acidimicrobiales bacterium]|nr:ABC transporter ATP-binding protein [Acidimicrobiales bacterium]